MCCDFKACVIATERRVPHLNVQKIAHVYCQETGVTSDIDWLFAKLHYIKLKMLLPKNCFTQQNMII